MWKKKNVAACTRVWINYWRNNFKNRFCIRFSKVILKLELFVLRLENRLASVVDFLGLSFSMTFTVCQSIHENYVRGIKGTMRNRTSLPVYMHRTFIWFFFFFNVLLALLRQRAPDALDALSFSKDEVLRIYMRIDWFSWGYEILIYSRS